MLRKPEDSFVWFDGEKDRPWPLDREALEPHYDEVERVLRPRPTRPIRSPTPPRPRRWPSQRAAAAVGLEVERPPLAISFDDGSGEPRPGLRSLPDDNISTSVPATPAA